MKDKPNPINIETNKRFKQFRKEVFPRQEDAAVFFGVKQSVISRIERGVLALNPNFRKKLVQEKRMNPKWYDTGIGNMFLNKEDKKPSLVVNVKDLQLDIDHLRSEVSSLRSSMKMILNKVEELIKEQQK